MRSIVSTPRIGYAIVLAAIALSFAPASALRTQRATHHADARGTPVRAAPRRSLLFVSNELSHDVSVIDLSTLHVIATIPVGARIRGIQPSPDGRHVYAALTENSRNEHLGHAGVVSIDVAKLRVDTRYAAGSDPEQLAVSPDGRRLYVSNEDAGAASVVDMPRHAVIATITVGVEPEGVAISPDGRLVYITAETSSNVTVIDTRTNKAATTFLVDSRPRSAVFSRDGKRSYVTAEVGGTVSFVDPSREVVIARVRLQNGTGKPVGVVVSPDGGTLYITNGHANVVSVVDVASRHEVAAIPIGHRPWGIAITHDGSAPLHS